MRKIKIFGKILLVVGILMIASCKSIPPDMSEKQDIPGSVTVPVIPDNIPESGGPVEKGMELNLSGIDGFWYICDADGWGPAADGLNEPAVVFEDGIAGIYTGLNTLLAGYSALPETGYIAFDTSGPMTLVAGTDHQMHFESALMKALPRVACFVLNESDGWMELYDAEDNLLLVLQRRKPSLQSDWM